MYNIRPLHFHSPKDNGYIFDSNIWLSVIAPSNYKKINKRYIDLFEKVHSRDNADIILCSVQASEIFNRVLRDVYMVKYAKSNNIPISNIRTVGYFKEKYRPTDHCKNAYEAIVDDFEIYAESLIYEPDKFHVTNEWSHFLDSIKLGLDFNDYLLFDLALKNNYTIVTNDSDFWVKNVEVVTANKKLIDKFNEHSVQESKPAAE